MTKFSQGIIFMT